MIKLAPSILAADFNILGQQISELNTAGAEYLHIDVMDGAFVPSISFGMPVITSIRKSSDMFFDCHLMIEEPDRYIDDFVRAGADMITVHAEACKHLHRTLAHIREKGLKCGVAVNPATSLEVLEEVYEDVDMVLIMSVDPGFGGQKFIPSTLEKLEKLKALAAESGYGFDIEVDGGVNFDNLRSIIDAGANVIVSGSTIFKGNIAENVARFKQIAQA